MISSIINLILAIPKLIDLYNSIVKAIEQNKENKHKDALIDLEKANNEEAIKDAARKLADNP